MRPSRDLLLSSFALALLLTLVAACDPEKKSKTTEPDADGDGSPDSEDCAPDDYYIYPGAAEKCNEIDDNCDGAIDEGVLETYYTDGDGDGFGLDGSEFQGCVRPDGASTVGGDCDDKNAMVRPGAQEECDGDDDNCDGVIDEDAGTMYYEDADEDGFGSETSTGFFCEPTDGWVDNNEDCYDDDPDSYPEADETCDEKDNDCDGTVDEAVQTPFYRDEDSDGYGENVDSVWACTAPRGYVSFGGDCDDTDSGLHPGVDDPCDGIDNDCDGITDELLEGSLLFDGADDTLYIGDCLGIDISGMGPITMEAWIYTFNNMADSPILSKEGSGTYQYWFGHYRSTFGFLLGTGSGWSLSARASGEVIGRTWTHLASVWDGAMWYNYMDGLPASSSPSGSYATAITDGSAPLTIGSNSSWDSTHFSGYISDVRIWNVARSQTQISENMYTLSDSTGLVARWALDEGSGGVATDAVGECHGRLGDLDVSDDADPEWANEVPSCVYVPKK